MTRSYPNTLELSLPRACSSQLSHTLRTTALIRKQTVPSLLFRHAAEESLSPKTMERRMSQSEPHTLTSGSNASGAPIFPNGSVALDETRVRRTFPSTGLPPAICTRSSRNEWCPHRTTNLLPTSTIVPGSPDVVVSTTLDAWTCTRLPSGSTVHARGHGHMARTWRSISAAERVQSIQPSSLTIGLVQVAPSPCLVGTALPLRISGK